LGARFLVFLEKIKKQAPKILFYFAAGGGEILLQKPNSCSTCSAFPFSCTLSKRACSGSSRRVQISLLFAFFPLRGPVMRLLKDKKRLFLTSTENP